MIIYVAGAYAKGDVVLNVRKAIEAGDRLLEKGYTPFIPHLTHFWHFISPKPLEQWYEIDRAFLERCDAIYMLDNWKQSKGAQEELKLAISLNKMVLYEELECR